MFAKSSGWQLIARDSLPSIECKLRGNSGAAVAVSHEEAALACPAQRGEMNAGASHGDYPNEW